MRLAQLSVGASSAEVVAGPGRGWSVAGQILDRVLEVFPRDLTPGVAHPEGCHRGVAGGRGTRDGQGAGRCNGGSRALGDRGAEPAHEPEGGDSSLTTWSPSGDVGWTFVLTRIRSGLFPSEELAMWKSVLISGGSMIAAAGVAFVGVYFFPSRSARALS